MSKEKVQYRLVRRGANGATVLEATDWIDVPGRTWMRKRAGVQLALGHVASDHTPANFESRNASGLPATDIEWRLIS